MHKRDPKFGPLAHSAVRLGFPTPPPGANVSPGSPLYDDDDRTPAEMGLVPFSPRYYETPDRDMQGMGHCSDAILAGAGLTVY